MLCKSTATLLQLNGQFESKSQALMPYYVKALGMCGQRIDAEEDLFISLEHTTTFTK
jgi:hypothetical protein